MRVMGGASGIIFGLLFYAGSKNRPPQPALTPQEFAALFQAGLREIQAKGQAKRRQTIVDALAPMVDALTDSVFQRSPSKNHAGSGIPGSCDEERNAARAISLGIGEGPWENARSGTRMRGGVVDPHCGDDENLGVRSPVTVR
jgi:dihydroxyacetone kinase-like protein